jgi:hypothetical protein
MAQVSQWFAETPNQDTVSSNSETRKLPGYYRLLKPEATKMNIGIRRKVEGNRVPETKKEGSRERETYSRNKLLEDLREQRYCSDIVKRHTKSDNKVRELSTV